MMGNERAPDGQNRGVARWSNSRIPWLPAEIPLTLQQLHTVAYTYKRAGVGQIFGRISAQGAIPGLVFDRASGGESNTKGDRDD